jgi:hypothetical protein
MWSANQLHYNLAIDMTVQVLMEASQCMAIHDNIKSQAVSSELEPGKVKLS